MQRTTSPGQFASLQATAQAPAITEPELQHLEDSVRAILENVATYQLVSATPLQVQEYFFLLEAYAHSQSPRPVVARQRLAQDALRLCLSLTPRPVQD